MSFVSHDGHRLYSDPRQCSHSNESVCATCDFDRYYASKYGHICPWFNDGSES